MGYYYKEGYFYLILIIIFFVVKIADIIIIIISLNIHLNYITDFIDKINLDFNNQRHDFKWNIIQLICS